MKRLPEIKFVSVIAKTAIFEVQAVDLRFSNGEERTYERLTPQRRSSVMVLPIHEGNLIFVREYAVGSERYELTFPKGIVDAGEEPIESANRELQEEIGFGARKIEPLRSLYSSPSHMFGLCTFLWQKAFTHPNLRAMSLNRLSWFIIRWRKSTNYSPLPILPKPEIYPPSFY